MRICYLATAGSIHTERWVRYFAENGHEVHLISDMQFRNNNDIRGIKPYILREMRPYVPVVSFFINHISNAIQIRRLVKKIKPDILHAHYATSWGFWGALSRLHPFVLTVWGSDILVEPKKHRILKLLVKWTLGKADLITCDADHMVQELIRLGASRDKIDLIRFGTDTQRFRPQPKNARLMQQLGIVDSPTVISLRSLRPIYDIESLVKAVPLVLAQVSDARFIIVGDGEQREYLSGLATSLGVSQNISFIGFVKNDELPQYLSLADVYVSTSLSDGGIAASTAEAMASGVPVIITDFGDNRRWVEDGESGVIVPMKDPNSLASKIVFLLQHEEIRQKFGRAGRKIIEEKNDHKKEMTKMENRYLELSRVVKK